MKIPAGSLVALMAASAISFGATFTVSNLQDGGAGSLRAAIAAANAQPGSTVVFQTSGTITLATPLPDLSAATKIDGTTAPGYSGVPVVALNFAGNPGLHAARGADGSTIAGLSLVGSGNAAVTLRASRVTVAGNYVGLNTDGSVGGNFGDGVRILSASSGNLIGNANAVEGVDYYDTTSGGSFPIQPVSAWQGIRNSGTTAGEYLICGTSGSNGLLYVGPIDGGGDGYTVNYPGASTISTSVYGPDNLADGGVRLVGSYRKTGSTEYNFGFVWEGSVGQLPSGGTFRTIAYPGATYQYTHSTMQDLAVGNSDGPALDGNLPLGAGKAYIYNLTTNTFVTNVVYPGSKSNTVYGIWYNGTLDNQELYTICGGYSPSVTSNLENPGVPLTQGKGFLVDYNATTNTFSNWTSFTYPNGPKGVNFITHFEGISSTEPGVYTLSADSVQEGTTNPAQGSWVSVRRNPDNTFDKGEWVDLDYDAGSESVSSSNSVYGFNVVGVAAGAETASFQAVINIAFQLSNVISGNRGNGITIDGSTDNIVSMNYIGTTPDGVGGAGYGNGGQGIRITGRASSNLIGGQAFGVNNPTGNKDPQRAVFQRPAQGNLISGNAVNGVLIDDNSRKNILSGNYIGTDAEGLSAVPNGADGVAIEKAGANSLLGCTFFQNPFVFYNVISGNARHGVRLTSADNIAIQANFLGMGADNATSVPNGGNGLLIEGTSQNTQLGGPIPLGNVISGNTGNGVEVRDRASGLLCFNTFGGISAFQLFASPNGRNGILITSTGGRNEIRTSLFSGNLLNGIEIGGAARGVTITNTTVGTDTGTTLAIPNQQNGIVLSGSAHDNVIGGSEPSILPQIFISGNAKYGVVMTDSAHDNTIFGTHIGLGSLSEGVILPNGAGGILLDRGTHHNTIGGRQASRGNTIQSNTTAGIYINVSRQNSVLNNTVTKNDEVGIYAFGPCTGTKIKGNTVTDNGPGGTNNVDLSKASGIIFVP